VAWVSVALAAVGLFIAAIPAEFAQLRVPCPAAPCPTGQLPPSGLRALEDLDLSLDTFAAYSVVMDVVFAAAYVAIAALIFWRKSEDRMGLFVSLALLTFGTATFSDDPGDEGDRCTVVVAQEGVHTNASSGRAGPTTEGPERERFVI
jgi:hypothetical protein